MAQHNVADDKPLIDKVYDLLASEKQTRTFYELANAIVSHDMDKGERTDILARLYTIMNMDGRFLSVGQNFWGLRDWYPVEQHDEEVANRITPKRKRKQHEDDYDDDYDDIDDDLDDIDDIDDDLDDTDFDDDDEDDDDLDDFDDDEEVVDDFDDDDTEGDDLDDELDLDEDSEDEE